MNLKKSNYKAFISIVILFLFCFLFSNSSAQYWNSARDYEPVILKGSQMQQLLNVKISELFVYSYNASESNWYQIPFQFDEKDDSTHFWNIGKNGNIDPNDELVFMAKDMGDEAPAESWIDNEDSKLNDRFELKLTDTIDNNKQACVYIFRSSTLTIDPALDNYVKYIPGAENASEDTIEAISYKEGHNIGGIPDYWTVSTAVNGDGSDILDRQKVRITLHTIIGDIPVNETLLEAFIPEIKYKDGRVRVLREAIWEISYFGYNFDFELLLKYYPYSNESGGISGRVKAEDQVKLIRQSFDLSAEAIGMTFYNPYNHAGYTVDGTPDPYNNTLDEGVVNWFMFTGIQGTYALLFEISSLGDERTVYYKDDSSEDANDTGDKKSYGDSGVLITGTAMAGNISFAYNSFFLGPNQEFEIGEKLAQNFESPLELNINPSGFVPVELANFSARVINTNSVELTWATISESNNYGFEVQRKSVSENNWETIGFVEGFGTTNSPKTYCYIDTEISEKHYYYRLKQIDFDGSSDYSSEIKVLLQSPESFLLSQNYPNPFNPETFISYQIPELSGESVDVELVIFNLMGDEVKTIQRKNQVSGYYNIKWDGKDNSGATVSAGTYVYQIKAGKFIQSKKMTLLR